MKKTLCIFLAVILLFSVCYADFDTSVIQKCTQYVQKNVPAPTVSSIGGEWAVIGLARSGEKIPDEYFEKYYKNLEDYIKSNDGVLHKRKYTEYSRVALAVSAIGKNPENVCSYSLTEPLSDFDSTVWQGINGAIWALIAVDAKNLDFPKTVQNSATRDMYIEKIISSQNSDGGWALNTGEKSDTDVTAMALCALAKYKNRPDAENAINSALSFLSQKQLENGGFETYGTQTCESVSQVVIALCTLNIAQDDIRFVKNKKTPFDNLMTFYDGNGGFYHTLDESSANLMATEQALCALSAYRRMTEGKNALYDMTDTAENLSGADTGLAKSPDIKKQEILYDKSFDDIKNNIFESEIAALASRGIINGKSDKIFDPDAPVTRSEFAAIVTKALGLSKGSAENKFTDVSESDWFCKPVLVCANYGIVKGISEDTFNPDGLITKEEAAVMICRAANLCGFDTNLSPTETLDIISAFDDYITVSEWAKPSLAFCFEKNILPSSDIEIKASAPATRAQTAAMTYNLLKISDLL